MLKWLERAMPHARVDPDNPLFKYEVRRIRWGETAKELSRYSFIILIIVQFPIWILWHVFMYGSGWGNPQGMLYYPMFERSFEFIRILFFVSLGATILLDVFSLVLIFRGLVYSGLWDLVQLSSIPMRDFISAKHTISQIHAWRLIPVIVSIRLGVVAVLGYSSFFYYQLPITHFLYP
jgi:hypothetical protein